MLFKCARWPAVELAGSGRIVRRRCYCYFNRMDSSALLKQQRPVITSLLLLLKLLMVLRHASSMAALVGGVALPARVARHSLGLGLGIERGLIRPTLARAGAVSIALSMSTTSEATSSATGKRRGRGGGARATKDGVSEAGISSSSSSSSQETSSPRSTYQMNTFSHENLPDETLYILDGTSMLFNAFHSRMHQEQFQGVFLTSESSQAVASTLKEWDPSGETLDRLNAVVGADGLVPCGTLTVLVHHFARFIKDVRPRYLCVAFDAGRATFRHDMYPLYKQHRPPAPPQLLPFFGLAPKVFEVLGARTFSEPGFEADDVMATLSRWARARGLNVVHVSPDKDMLQLIEPGVHVMVPWSREMVGADEVESRYGVPPKQLVDLQSLVGDRADNVPGVAGIGVKTASALMRRYSSIENLYAHLGITAGEPSAPPESRIVDADRAITELEEGLQGVRMSPRTMLNKLLNAPHEELLLFKRLITLRDDVAIDGLDIDGSGDIRGTSSPPLNTQDFRYTGEERGADVFLQSLSVSLLSPLNQLRLTYHRLDREE